MDRATWTRLRPILESALERSPGEREAFVRAACAGDEALAARGGQPEPLGLGIGKLLEDADGASAARIAQEARQRST